LGGVGIEVGVEVGEGFFFQILAVVMANSKISDGHE